MAEGAAHAGERYWAFVSYSHKDTAFGRRLHRRLESYQLPRRLAGRVTARGTVPARLAPVFRDREELAAANDLSAEVRAALAQSRSLVVVCSPAAAASPWVSREVQLFRALHPDRPIFAALYQGEPGESFPSALKDGQSGGEAVEPLAADFRKDRDGDSLGFLKLVAGIAGLPLDELVQRDAHRRARRVTAITAGALVAVVVMAVLTFTAIAARFEAERQHGKAEDLVEFMLTDLRHELKGVGRLDVMKAVNERALHYYADQDLAKLPADSLERRARILHAMGEDDETRGDVDAALAKFREAARTTAALLAAKPDDPERIFDHAQSEFYIGLHEYNQHNFAAAKKVFLAYKGLADRLVSIAPANPKYHQEVGYADSNLCAVAQEKPVDVRGAIRTCTDALAETEWATRRSRPSSATVSDLIERHAWLADAYRYGGEYTNAEKERLTEKRMLEGLIVRDEKNMDLRATGMAILIALAEIDRKTGRSEEAISTLKDALKTADMLRRFDPSNQDWMKQRDYIAHELDDWNASAKKTKGATK